jgi:hypothetical protein
MINVNDESLILTSHDYIEYLRHAPAGSTYFYKKDTPHGFNVRKIKDTMSAMGVEVFYVGNAGHIGRNVHQIKILRNSIPLEEIKKDREPKFFDPKNLI